MANGVLKHDNDNAVTSRVFMFCSLVKYITTDTQLIWLSIWRVSHGTWFKAINCHFSFSKLYHLTSNP